MNKFSFTGKKYKQLDKLFIGIVLLFLISVTGCIKSMPENEPWVLEVEYQVPTQTNTSTPAPQRTPFLPVTREPGKPMLTPTPDSPKVLPTIRVNEEIYSVQMNDSLNVIARRFGVDLLSIVNANNIFNPDLLEIGQVLVIPPPNPDSKAPEFKIIPDSELVYSPSTIGFDPHELIYSFDSYLSSLDYSDEVILQVAQDHSVNPRLLITLLEYATGWVTGPNENLEEVPLNEEPETDAWETGLYSLLSRMANSLNWGYYSWKADQLGYFVLVDGSYIPADETSNAATVAIQYWSATLYGKDKWYEALSEKGIFSTYSDFFGYPFDFSVEPLIPEGLTQPEFVLPFQRGVAWSFTGGPHPGWGDGSAWAALDFAPPGSPMGCNVSGDWVTAITDGIIVRSENGAVIQDLDGDGLEQTGWTILYLHISSWERVEAGTVVKTGDFIGHPSCEGGVSSGTHLHIARKYNGEWIDAVGDVPFVMSGFQPQSEGIAYNGYLVGNGVFIEAWKFFRPESLVQH
ncbi:MAG TPA: LysM peptidoglycan-binding domain-containing protein [Anaerolineaceae bacterium]|nr:LysM peptidoglycan-binding domain-containing protein [Anaerolineaceae bacterium]